MKKLLICLLFVNFVTFTSFASSPIQSEKSDLGDGMSLHDSVTITDAESPDNDNKEKSEQVTEKTLEMADIEKENSENSIPSPEPVNEVKKDDLFQYPEPGDIKEPEITTLEPEAEDEKEELVNTELPPLSENKNKETTKEINTTENETKAENKVIAPAISSDKIKETKENISAEKENSIENQLVGENTNEDVKEQEPVVAETVAEENVEPKVEVIKPSRSVTMKRREYIDVTYPGIGWIYTGLVDGSKDLSYFGRAIGTKDTTFTLQAVVPGTKVLHFCKNDYLTGSYIDDYIEVIVLQEEGSNKTHIEAPEYKQPEPKAVAELGKTTKDDILISDSPNNNTEFETTSAETTSTSKDEIKSENKTSNESNTTAKEEKQNEYMTQKAPLAKANGNTVSKSNKEIENNKSYTEKVSIPAKKSNITPESSVIDTDSESDLFEYDDITIPDFEEDGITIPEEDVVETTKNSDVTDCDTLLKEAEFLYNEKEFEAAFEKVNVYLEIAATNIDAGLLLKGKILEAKSELQDIKGAIKVYNTLMKEYPASQHWNEANKRVIYLKRFYLEVR